MNILNKLKLQHPNQRLTCTYILLILGKHKGVDDSG